jgi:hypothetical protein
MTPLWVPVDLANIRKPAEHPAGSIIAIIPTSRKVPPICWALRFDFVASGSTTPCLYLINGNPWNQHGGVIVQCNDGHLDDRCSVGFSSPNARVRIEFDLNSRILARDVGYYEQGPFVAIGDFGFRLCGQDSFRPERAQVWIDCDRWVNDSEAFQRAMNSSDVVNAYAPNWRVLVTVPELKRSFTVDFVKHEVVP